MQYCHLMQLSVAVEKISGLSREQMYASNLAERLRKVPRDPHQRVTSHWGHYHTGANKPLGDLSVADLSRIVKEGEWLKTATLDAMAAILEEVRCFL